MMDVWPTAAAPVVKKYLGVLAASDVYTQSNAYTLQEPLRLDSGGSCWSSVILTACRSS